MERVREELPKADFSSASFAADFNKNNKEFGFNAVTGFEDVRSNSGRTITELKDLLYTDLNAFSQLSHEQKMKYHRPETDGQRGYTPDGIEQSGILRELREHIMMAAPLPEGHPLGVYVPYFYKANVPIADVPNLTSRAEELLSCLGDLSIAMFEKVEQNLGFPFGTLASKLVYGQSFLRAHIYPKPDEVLDHRVLDGVEAIGGERVDGIDVVDLIYRGQKFENVCRASPHPDTGYFTLLLGSEVGGLNILRQDGTPMSFKTEPDTIVANAADFVEKDILSYKSVIHWVGLTPDTAQQQRLSIVNFIHPRPRARVGDKEASILLFDRLHEIGYMDVQKRDTMFKAIGALPSDDEMIQQILQWEKTQEGLGTLPSHLLSRYFHLTNEKTGTFERRKN